MFRYNTLLTTFLALVLFSAGCDKVIYDQREDDGGGSQPIVYLSVTRDGTSKFRGSPDLPDDPTINEDVTHWEDRVHDLALLVFDTSTGDLVTTHFETSAGGSTLQERFTIELTTGQRDFYFVANMPKPALEAISNRNGMETYLDGLYDLSANLYKAASSSVGFPMSRVYKNQTITKGGTVYMPAPFKPDGQEKVLLIRVVAKLEVKVHEDEADAVQSITLKNAFKEFHLQHGVVTADVAQNTNTPHATITHHGDVVLTKQALDPVAKMFSYIAYMPEALMSNATWTGSGDHKPVNYFVIETTSGIEFEIPVITAADYTYGQNYMAYAKNDNDLEKYNIYRNRRYLYEVKNLSDIEVQYNIKDWTQVPTTLFMGYGYNVIIDESGKITIENTIDDCMPHKVRLEAKNGAHFGGGATDTAKVYGYSSKDETGYDESKAKTGYSEQFGPININDVTKGDDYLEIFYNDVLVKTYTK